MLSPADIGVTRKGKSRPGVGAEDVDTGRTAVWGIATHDALTE
jgi:hypothetical protein